ncbi:MAG TPA: 16S rRNA (adenine(1518)-N(6)/adenine(1519)-N(6))-dimethyltransferase RsmA [Saprospiraceae bacterium]|nr:16S rRNA (adenine(1518)-N(6)/adenine(1519)-N(6))-dimethyltransferase RsmA [Saprospiraceae bacterium]HMP13076.1 16S rRNA (adenine(1518)-N(6)/adenine(1519)-N(6))-dimethyltransferase RsmA [Saprospiraceae bacterium]
MKAKKSYGQHFLTNEHLARSIADATDPSCKRLLEVGPGRGMLTKYLLEKPAQLVTVEADRDMVAYLEKFYPQLKGQIVEADFLKVNLEKIFDNQEFTIIGNFPYNISSQIVFKMIDARQLVPELVGMFQKEMAARIIAPPGDKTYGVISVLTQAYYEGTYLFTVGSGNFAPPPKVQSAVIRLRRRANLMLDCNEAIFRQVVKQAFGQRRKMLRNSLRGFFSDEAVLQDAFFQQRPEQLSVQDYVHLAQKAENQ